MESDKMKHFNTFDWCKKCTPKIRELAKSWDESVAKKIGQELNKNDKSISPLAMEAKPSNSAVSVSCSNTSESMPNSSSSK